MRISPFSLSDNVTAANSQRILAFGESDVFGHAVTACVVFSG
jgi:hypothetical protein